MQQVAAIPDSPPKKYGLTGLMTLKKGVHKADVSCSDIVYYLKVNF